MSESAENTENFTKKVVQGTAWMVAGRFLMRGLGFISLFILARLLLPEDFGLVIVAATTMQLLQNFSDIGASQTVVKFRDTDKGFLDTLFTLSLIRGVMVSGIMLCIAPFAETLFGDPRTGMVFAVVAMAPFFLALKNPKFHEDERDMDFSKIFITDAISKIVSVGTAVSIALLFKSYWAIVASICIAAFMETLCSYILKPYRPRLSFSSLPQLWKFTGWITGVSFVTALNNKLDVLLMPRLTDTATTGVFSLGHQVSDMPTEELAAPLAKALYPGFSSMQEDPAKMDRVFLGGVEALGAIGLPMAVGLAFVATDFVPLVLGDKWLSIIPVFQIYAPAAGLMLLFTALQGYAIARDKTKYILFREIMYFVFRTPLFIFCAISYGLIGAVIATSAATLFRVLQCMFVYGKLSGKSMFLPFIQARRSFIACGAIAAYFFALEPLILPDESLNHFFQLIINVTIAGSLYVVALFGIWKLEGKPKGTEQLLLDSVLKR